MSIVVHHPRTPRIHVRCSTQDDFDKLREVATGAGYSAPDNHQALNGARGPRLNDWPIYVGWCPCEQILSEPWRWDEADPRFDQ